MKRKLVSVLLVAAMGVSVLAGCGGSNSGKTDEDKKAAVSDEMYLSFITDIIRIKVNGLQHR